ncbi:hypothetical protein PISL3812_09697 [Talaromyces islandicus]|uniref:BZIP domain-containing protein n=1 Tax=Talaromyces islandicus TaxID=28573 RepID=A0A0U1MAJ1_TALIS|nr:hypothetical protein PISL3812_09697 [Talaromyces islandicus]
MTFGLAISEHTHPSGHPPSSETSLMLKPPCVENLDALQGSDPAELVARIDDVRKQTTNLLLVCSLQRRRAQNRASQRAFRERKEKHIKTLEAQLSSLETEHSKLLHCHHEQRRMLDRMKAHVQELTEEIETLRCSRAGDQVAQFTTFDLVPSAQVGDVTSPHPDRRNDTDTHT